MGRSMIVCVAVLAAAFAWAAEEKKAAPAEEILGQPVTFELQNVSLADAAKKLAELVNVKIVVDEESAKAAKPVTASAKDVMFSDALDTVLEQAGCKYITKKGVIYVGTETALRRYMVDADVTQGALCVERPDGTVVECPLKHTNVVADICGFIARVTVTQTFYNPLKDESIEAVYVFPLPHG